MIGLPAACRHEQQKETESFQPLNHLCRIREQMFGCALAADVNVTAIPSFEAN